MLKLQRRLAFVAVPAVLALGVASYASVVAFSSPSPNPTGIHAPTTAETAESTAEAPETAESTAEAPETAEPNEPALPGGGYADKDNTQADTQQEGVN